MKKLSSVILRNSLLFFATLFTISTLQVAAQTSPQAPAVTKPVARITEAIDEKNLVQTGGIVHSLARAEFDRGIVADSQPMNRMLLLLQRSPVQEAALRGLLDEQQTKGSPNYHAWLTPDQFGQQFGVAASDVQKVTDWLSQEGFTGIKVKPGQMVIEFSGTAGLVRTAFHTEIHNFMVDGKAHMANVSRPQIPAALSPVVSGVVSLHNFRKTSYLHQSAMLAKVKAAGKLKPGFTAAPCAPSVAPGTCYGLGPADFAKIYNIPSNLDGTGQTIALVARSNITVSDINQFGQGFGISNLSTFSAASNILLESSDPGIIPGDDLEATLDIEASGSVAPKATILLVVSDGTVTTGNFLFSDGTDLSALYIIGNNLAPIMSESFGSAEEDTFTPFFQTLWEQGAAQGITIMISTGDSGSASIDGDNGNLEALNGVAVSGVASTPFNTAVGGTDFNDGTNPTTYWNATNSGTGLLSAKSYIPEVPWNDSCAATATVGSLATCPSTPPDDTGLDLAGGGGGQSGPCGTQSSDGTQCLGPVPKPSWQAGTGVPADGTRDLPDVSLFAADGSASGNFWIICYAGIAGDSFQNGEPCNLTGAPAYNFTAVGGTSAASPAFAGIMALVNQSQAASNPTGRQGNANYVLYKLAQTTGASCNAALPATITNTNCIFYDVTTGNNSVECAAGTPNCSNQTASGNGVLVEPTGAGFPFLANTPAWSATAGYDLATGLGSVNVANLTSKWGTIFGAFKAATTTITSPATGTVNITHGANVNFTVTVASNPAGGAAPTGDVSLIAEPPGFPQVGLTGGTLTNGTITFSTANSNAVNFLPGDTATGAGTPYPVIAHYGGDGNYAPSDSAPIMVTVNRENSSVQTTMYNWAGNTPFTETSDTYGDIYLFRFDVLGSAPNDNVICANVAIPCPTGTITLTYDGGKPLNDFVSTASGGSTNVANLTPLGFVEDRLLGNITGLPGGSHTIVAAYSGDNSYNSNTAPSFALTINPAATLVTSVTANGSTSTSVSAGQQVTLVAYVYGCVVLNGSTCGQPSNGAGPTGSVTFSACGTATSCKVSVVPVSFINSGSVDAYATATLATTFATAGTQNISATFTTGDTNYLSCTTGACNTAGTAKVTVTGGVGPAAKLAFTGQPSAVVVGSSITPAVTVAVEDASGNVVTSATNAVTIAIGANPGGGTLGGTLTATPVNGIATFSNLTVSKAGTGYTLAATATGLTSATSNAFNVSTAVGPAAKLAFTVQPSNVVTGVSITPAVAVTVQDASGNTVTTATNAVTVAFLNNAGGGTLGGTLTATPTSGVATFSNLTVSAAGTGYTLTATATGLTSASSAAFNVTVTPSFTVATTPSPVVLSSATGATVNATVTITSVNGFASPVTVVCPTTLPAGFTCAPPSAITPPANGNASGMLGLAVAATSTSLSASNISPDQMLDAKTTPVIPGAKGWWALSAGTGFAALFLVFLPGGRKRFRAALGLGLACLLSFSLGCSNNGSPVVTKTATTTKMTVNADKEPSGTAFTFSVTVTGGTPTGMVQLFDGATAIGTAAAVAGGTASPTAPALSVGTHSISAHYLGDSTTAISSSGSLNLTSTGSTTITITTTPAATPVAPPVSVIIQ